MSYDERLAGRVRDIASSLDAEVTERSMFGGLCFLRRGKMFVGIVGNELMVRVGKDIYEAALAEPHVREMDFTGRPMRGYVYVEPRGVDRDEPLQKWVTCALREATRVSADATGGPRRRPSAVKRATPRK